MAFTFEVLEVIQGIEYETKEEEGFTVVRYKPKDLCAERTIWIDEENRQVVVYTESTTVKGSPDTWDNCVQYVSRVNEFLMIGCFEIKRNSFNFSLKMGQKFASEANPKQIVDFFLGQQDYFFPKLIEGAVHIVSGTKSPIESSQLFIKPLH